MLEFFPYGKRSNYPHMMPGDVAIWEKFIEQNPEAYDSVAYDVKVGTPAVPVIGVDANIEKDIAVLTQRKIDVVGLIAGFVDIIEIKPRAGSSALGQVKSYETLYKRDVNPEAKTRAVVLTDTETPDLALLAGALGVGVHVVK